jgi:hypothetical protein
MDLIKKVLGFVLGAGAGMIGTVIRTGIAAVAGYFLSKGFIDSATATTLTNQLVGVALSALAALGSYLNNGVMLNTPVPDPTAK